VVSPGGGRPPSWLLRLPPSSCLTKGGEGVPFRCPFRACFVFLRRSGTYCGAAPRRTARRVSRPAVHCSAVCSDFIAGNCAKPGQRGTIGAQDQRNESFSNERLSARAAPRRPCECYGVKTNSMTGALRARTNGDKAVASAAAEPLLALEGNARSMGVARAANLSAASNSPRNSLAPEISARMLDSKRLSSISRLLSEFSSLLSEFSSSALL